MFESGGNNPLNEFVVEEAALTTFGERGYALGHGFKGPLSISQRRVEGINFGFCRTKTKTLVLVPFPSLFCLKRRASD